MNTTADEARVSILLRSIPWLLFSAGFCLIVLGGIAAGMHADDIGLIIGGAMLMLLPVNIIAFLLARLVHRLLASTCAGVVFVLACIVLLETAVKHTST